jgi:hypothetical protein
LAVLPHDQDTIEKWDLKLEWVIRPEAIACSTRLLPKRVFCDRRSRETLPAGVKP